MNSNKVNKQRNRGRVTQCVAPYMGARGFPADLNSHYKQTTSKYICGMSIMSSRGGEGQEL